MAKSLQGREYDSWATMYPQVVQAVEIEAYYSTSELLLFWTFFQIFRKRRGLMRIWKSWCRRRINCSPTETYSTVMVEPTVRMKIATIRCPIDSTPLCCPSIRANLKGGLHAKHHLIRAQNQRNCTLFKWYSILFLCLKMSFMLNNPAVWDLVTYIVSFVIDTQICRWTLRFH